MSDPQISPDDKLVAFTVQTADHNALPQQIYVVPSSGGAPRQITREGSRNERPRWSPDSRMIAFVSNRGGSAQIRTVHPDGAEARQITNLSTEAGGELFTPDGNSIVVQSDVYPGCADDNCNRARLP